MITYSYVRWIGGKAYRVGSCLSSDTKPTDDNLKNGSRLFEMDTGTYYVYDEASRTWLESGGGGGGKAAAESSIAKAIRGLNYSPSNNRITSLDGTELASASLVEAVGTPVYVADPAAAQYVDFNLVESGWYVFARVTAPEGISASAETVITGADGVIVTVGETHVDIAVRFDVAASTRHVTVDWGTTEDVFDIKATDLAVRNLDYRTTFYVYDLAEFCTWEYALTADTTFAEGKNYYTEDNGVYTLAEVTAGEAVPANTYYNHSKLTISGMTRNITYRLDEIVDCPQEVVLPDIEDDTHGAWFEFQLRHSGSFSMTLTVPEGVKIATEHTQSESAGFNLIDLHYMFIDGVKMWRFMNTHSSIPTT